MRKTKGFEGQRMIVLPKSIRETLINNDFTKNLFVTDVGYYPNAKRHFRERKQGCDENILIICEKGRGKVEINGIENSLGENQYIIIPKNTAHRYYADIDKPWSIYWLHFSGEMDNHFTKGSNTTQTITSAINERTEDRYQLFEEIFTTLDDELNLNNLEYSCILLTHLLGSLKYIRQFRNTKTYKAKDNVSLAISFMKQHLSEKLTLLDIAKAANLSNSQISLKFKEQTGKAPLEYFTFLKIQKACVALSLSDEKIKDIALELGFTDAYYFSRVFTKVMGLSPFNYRKREQFGM